MTFKETEHTEILRRLNEFAETVYPVNEIVKETYRLYKKVPIYLGIVGMCMENILKPTKYEELKVGNTVIVKNKNNIYEGKVAKIKKSYLELKNVKVIQQQKKLKVKIGKRNEIKKINFDTLRNQWPSLDFKKEKR